MNEKRFIGVWGEGYINDSESAIVENDMTEKDFGGDNGYDDDDRGLISSLEIGQSANIPAMGELHSVIRTK